MQQCRGYFISSNNFFFALYLFCASLAFFFFCSILLPAGVNWHLIRQSDNVKCLLRSSRRLLLDSSVIRQWLLVKLLTTYFVNISQHNTASPSQLKHCCYNSPPSADSCHHIFRRACPGCPPPQEHPHPSLQIWRCCSCKNNKNIQTDNVLSGQKLSFVECSIRHTTISCVEIDLV